MTRRHYAVPGYAGFAEPCGKERSNAFAVNNSTEWTGGTRNLAPENGLDDKTIKSYLSGPSGSCLSFFLTVVGAAIARARGWVFIVGLVLFALARGGREIDAHLRDDAEKPAAAR